MLATFLFLILSTPIFAYQWSNVAIRGGGFIAGIVYSKTQKDLLYARTDVGGAYRWNAANSSWIPLLDGTSSSNSASWGVLSLATDSLDPTRVYLATGLYTSSWAGNANILISTNYGNSWTTVAVPFKLGGNEDGRGNGERLQVDPNLNSILFLGTTDAGLWRSTNYGSSWSQVASFPTTGINFVAFDPSSSSKGSASKHIFVSTTSTSSDGLYLSTNGGSSWSVVPGTPSGLTALRFAFDGLGNLYITFSNAIGPNGAANGKVMKLTLSNLAWKDVSPPAGQGGFAGISVDSEKPTTIMVSTLDRWWPKDEIYRSTNGGSSWTALDAISTFSYSLAPYVNGMTPHWINDLTIDPFNSANVWFTTGYGLWSTTTATAADSGQSVTWNFENVGLEETVPLGLISPPSGAPLYSVLGDVDGFRHDNLAVSPVNGRYQPSVGTTTGIDIAWLQPNIVVRVHNQVTYQYGFYSKDGGSTWISFGSAPSGTTGGGTIAVSAQGSTLVWSSSGGPISYSTDDGISWSSSSGLASGLKVIADRSNNNVFYGLDGVNGKAYVSWNGGKSFNVGAQNLPSVPSYASGNTNIQSVPGFVGDIWVTANSLYRSTNYGSAFTQITSVQSANLVAFGKAPSGQTYPSVFIYGQVNNVYGIFRSDNQGSTWVQINDVNHQFGSIGILTGDSQVFGRVYVGTSGRGIIYGSP